MSTYEPGTVAVATVRGVPNVRVFRGEGFWRTAVECGGNVTHHDFNDGVTDVRPLVVLDLDAALDHMGGGMSDLPDVLKDMRRGGGIFADRIADQIEQQTKPLRIPEPGLWGVVEAGVREHDQRLRWVRLGDNYRPDDRDEYDRLWSDLIDPTLVRPGIEDGAS
jgi:hypothetical protein